MADRDITNVNKEKYLERKLREYIESKGGKCIKLIPFNSDGIPDRLCLLPGGLAIFVEVKTKGQKPRKLQLYWHKLLDSLGFIVYVLDSYDKLEQLKAEL